MQVGVLKTFHSVNTNPEVLLVQNEYNEIGQDCNQELYSTDGGKYIQAKR